MDLVTFADGIQSIQIKKQDDTPAGNTASRPFVPMGESVVQHTETLFAARGSEKDALRALISPPHRAGIDPNEFQAAAAGTFATLTALTRENATDADPAYHRTLQQALAVLNGLQEDRQLLQSYLTSLEKV